MSIEITDARNASIIANSTDWRSATDDIIAFWTSEGRPYSSGEVAATIRTHRTDLSFSVPSVGGYLRDKFYANTLPQYTDDGDGNGPVSPLQRSRYTVGKYRTGSGVEVFVYGRNSEDCDNHEFEVWIPSWDAAQGRMLTQADCPTPTTTAPSSASAPGSVQHATAQAAFAQSVANNTQQAANSPGGKITIGGAKPGVSDFVATVRAESRQENRLYVGRGAFEALCHLSGTPIRAGSPVFIKVEPHVKVTITLTDPGNGAKPYHLVAGKGNVGFYSGDKSKPFDAGAIHPITITATEMTVDLTKTL